MANYDTDSAIVDSVKFAKLVTQTYGRSSLTRNAKDTVAQYPVIFSADIPTEDAVIVAKALEAQYAALLISIISASSDYDRSRYKNPVDYLKVFYNNSNTPPIFASIDSEIPTGAVLEAAIVYPDMDRHVPTRVAMECWIDTDIQFNSSRLNASYQPAYHTQSVMESVVSNLRNISTPAMEAASDTDEFLNAIGAGRANRVNSDDYGVPSKNTTTNRTTIKGKTQVDDQGRAVIDSRTGKPIKVDETRTEVSRSSSASTGVQSYANYNDKLGNMAPTMINVQLNSHHGNAPVITHNVVMGVKAMVRSVPQDLMISNLAEGVNDTRKMFKFIKWTEGEYKLIRSLILGIDDAKAAAASNRDMKHWLEGLKRRKRADTLSKLSTGFPIPPMTTIIATSYEVAKVYEMTGLDLSDAFNAMKLISKYYLLGFGIYDSESGKIKAIFDGDTAFSINTISGLKGKQQKEQDLVQYAQFIRAAGRM